ncbi:macrolide family glycosyltransferase [Priestia taiwanensis]|uniref:Glycosyl transferase family 1 n=1 Tax=Priestia taiwanensis TaxID=1347902 RepID=A0A917ATS3_9BACI|nr:macrolide family glycosyltransferase [Priestia taiwanensis]MBM7363885.1 MGT family glycosyltransferase [Priestia taiwanensis]GGE69807.1 glycosyl transferase family 1 [Priestia taiwanensis]
MSKVLFMNGPAEGHMNPTLGLVEELIRRGEEVVYFTTEEFQDKIEKTGATFRSYENYMKILPPPTMPDFTLMHLLQILLRSSEIIVPTVLEKTKGEKFDYIIHDSMFGSGRMLAQLLKIPSVSSVTSFAFQGLDNFPPEVIGPKEFLDETKALASEISQKFQLETPSLDEIFFSYGDLNIVYTSRLFQPFSEGFGDEFVFVGPSITDRQEDIEFPFAELEKKKVIYISFGTVVNENIDFYHTCFEALRDFDGKVILSVGTRIDLQLLGDIPSNFIVKRYVPQLDVLKYTDLFITHGGMNSTSEALYYHVPLLVIPQTSDQPFIAARVAELGAGVSIFTSPVTAHNLREAVQTVLRDTSFQKNSTMIGESFKEAGGFTRAVDKIFTFKKLHNIRG